MSSLIYILQMVWIFAFTHFNSVAQLCPILCDATDCSMPGFPAHHKLLEPTQTHVHHVGDTTISSSVIPFFSHLQSLPASWSFPMSQFFASGGQSIGTSASILPMNIQNWFLFRLTGLISLLSKGLSESSPTSQFKSISSSAFSFLKWSNSHIHTWLLEKS